MTSSSHDSISFLGDMNSCFEKKPQVVSDQSLIWKKGKVMYDHNVGNQANQHYLMN